MRWVKTKSDAIEGFTNEERSSEPSMIREPKTSENETCEIANTFFFRDKIHSKSKFIRL